MKMKKILLMFLMATAPGFVGAQHVYKGQLHISDERFARQGDLLRVYMKVSYNDNAVNTGETLLFTPVIKSDSLYARLSSVAIDGSARSRYRKRKARLQKSLRRQNVPVVIRDERGGAYSFTYDTTIPWQDWMAQGGFYVETEESSWQGRKPHMYEDILQERLVITAFDDSTATAAVDSLPAPQPIHFSRECIQFLSPSQVEYTCLKANGQMALAYDKKYSTRQFRLIADTLAALISRETARLNGKLLSMDITAYGAPIGNRDKNEQRAVEQTLKLKQVLQRRGLAGSGNLHVTWVAEDWDSIAVLANMADMPLREATTDIIRNIGVTSGREEALRNLGSGASYQYLRKEVFPKVCRLQYDLNIAVGAAVKYTSSRKWHQLPTNITPDNFYQTASAFTFGSQEFCDIIDLAARLFPESAEASIDGAGVALMKGDAAKARGYLTPWMDDPRSYCNLGLLYLLEGNRDKAEVYLRMASTNGVAGAARALKEVKE